MGADKLAKNIPNAPKSICPNCLPKPKILRFRWKKALLGVCSLCSLCNSFYDHITFSKGTVFLSDDLTVCTIPENLTIDNDSSNQGSIDYIATPNHNTLTHTLLKCNLYR